jgi:hypothetical protein
LLLITTINNLMEDKTELFISYWVRKVLNSRI